LATFFTIGHSTRSTAEFIQILESSEIGVLVDVRAIPRSRTNPQFNRDRLPETRHTHPGIESAYFLEGGFELPIQGQATRTVKAGDAVQIPAETPHAGGKAGDAKTRVLITYVVEKGKPLASPA
jgi:mannose-6-phosphate isomerase class I